MDLLLNADKLLEDQSRRRISITLIGDGNQKEKLQQYSRINNLDNIIFEGTRPNKEIPQFLLKQDVLVLPSLHDGWGAVINEALHNGLFVIASDACGAKDLLNVRRGLIFRSGDAESLMKCMDYCIQNISRIRSDRLYRIKWSKEHIDGKVLAHYMIDCLSGKDILPPWKKD